MRKWICVVIVLLSLPNQFIFAQPKDIPPPPEFQKLIGPATFEPAKLRQAIAFPFAQIRCEFLYKTAEEEEEIPPVAVIEKKLVGDERDADWLLKLGYALDREKSDRAKDAYEKSAAAFRRRSEREPKVARHYLDLCDPLYELGRMEAIVASAKKCVELEPKNARGWRRLAWCYWEEFSDLVYDHGRQVDAVIDDGRPPAEIVKPLTEAQREQARALLERIQESQREWQRHARTDAENLDGQILFQMGWELFDNYFRTGTWPNETTSFCVRVR